MPVLDTDFLIDLHAGEPHARQALARIEDGPLVVPYQAALEFLHGTLDWQAEMEVLEASFHVAPATHQVLAVAARMVSTSRARNVRVRSADAWIAAHAEVLGTFVVSRNKGHYRLLDVRCWDWRTEKRLPR